MKADLTWAGLPYHMWKEGKKISDPLPCTHEREGANLASRQLGVVELWPSNTQEPRSAVGCRKRAGEEDSRPSRYLIFDRWRDFQTAEGGQKG